MTTYRSDNGHVRPFGASGSGIQMPVVSEAILALCKRMGPAALDSRETLTIIGANYFIKNPLAVIRIAPQWPRALSKVPTPPKTLSASKIFHLHYLSESAYAAMSSTSNTSVYHAQTPRKPEHFYSSHPPTTHAVDRQSLQTYRLSSYGRSSHSPIMASSSSAACIEEAHQKRVREQTEAILSRFYQR
ncbi:hypothetical protein CIB48_g4771 [Xylaria polymorpha]|nr:hypothetical protein CIB48_g4771 [Xylaria polymorpha]